MLHELTVVISEADEATHISTASGRGRLRNGRNYTRTKRPSMGWAARPGRSGVTQGPAGRAKSADDQGGTAEDVVHVAYENRRHHVSCKPKAPTRNSYWLPGTRNEVFY